MIIKRWLALILKEGHVNISFNEKLNCLIFLLLFISFAAIGNASTSVLNPKIYQSSNLERENRYKISTILSNVLSETYKFLTGIKLRLGRPLTIQEKLEAMQKKIRENKGNQYLYDAICSAQEGKLQDASILLEQARDAYIANGAESLNAIHIVADFIETEKKRYHDLYIDKHEIPYAFCNDPLYAEYHKILDVCGPDYNTIQSKAVSHLIARQLTLQSLYEKLAITERTALFDKLFYGIADFQDNPLDILGYFSSQDICRNSLIEEHRHACSILFTESGLLKLYAYQSEYALDDICLDINNGESLTARVLQTGFYMHIVQNSEEVAFVRLGLKAIHKSVSCDGVAKKIYLLLALTIFEKLIEEKVSGIYALYDKINQLITSTNDKNDISSEHRLRKSVQLIFEDELLSQYISRDLIVLYEQLDTHTVQLP